MPKSFVRHIVVRGYLISALIVTLLTFMIESSVVADNHSPRSQADQTLRQKLSSNDIAGALKTAPATWDKDKAYLLIASQQTQTGDFEGARKTIRHITVGSTRLPRPGLIEHSTALTALARGLYAAGRKAEARTALAAAMSDAARIPDIFAEMGEGFGPMAGERWIDIADVQLSVHDRRAASRSLDMAERFAAGSHLGYDASSVLTCIEKDRHVLGQTAGEAKAHRELKLAAANSITDISVKAEALIDVDATDGNAAGVIETARQQAFAENPVGLLCHGVRTINRIHGDLKCRKRLLDAARKLSSRTKDPKFKKMEQDMIAQAEAGAASY